MVSPEELLGAIEALSQEALGLLERKTLDEVTSLGETHDRGSNSQKDYLYPGD